VIQYFVIRKPDGRDAHRLQELVSLSVFILAVHVITAIDLYDKAGSSAVEVSDNSNDCMLPTKFVLSELVAQYGPHLRLSQGRLLPMVSYEWTQFSPNRR
jgi:hypothetical protein